MTDSGRGFWLQLDDGTGFNVSHIYPALYCLHGSDGDCVAVMASHVDDLLYAYLSEEEETVRRVLLKFDLGSTEIDNCRYCGKQFARDPDGTITVDVRDSTRREVKLRFPMNHLKLDEIALLTVTDASFSNEANYRSQQGRFHFVTGINEAKDPKNTYRVLPLSFGSTTIRRVCRSTLQAETYSLQHGLEAGDKLRGVIAELKGQIRGRQKREEDQGCAYTTSWFHRLSKSCRSPGGRDSGLRA